ncbi:helix-turn-helix domain-containing protein [Streptomyces sp. ISL-98]|uniref:helix-turn-helix domain-containing protein n=1 Tax=Streptomyces sp. ISL-98 TaxID=2819192 RepID=UPI001BEC2BA5|nr:helix-turn-helix domain-containing protein [Streptomyces sp. ISL-98]MBT2505144.1 helix-turn-helix domain-containing protein [Streptomyces sp. ISL-98]
MGGQHARVTDEDRNQVRALHAQGLGRNEIARQIGRAQRTVSVLAAEMGLVFDVTMTEDATRHRVAQLAEKRTILADALTDDALRLSEQVWQPATIYNFGGKDNTYEARKVPEPPAADKRQLMAAATNAAAQSLRLVPPELEASGVEAARSMLTGLADGIRLLATTQEDDGEEG